MGDYKIGDTIRIRQWSDLIREYGLTRGRSVRCSSGVTFAPGMRKLCGAVFTISEIIPITTKIGVINSYLFAEGDLGWTITDEMFEIHEDEVDINAENKKLERFLSKFQIIT